MHPDVGKLIAGLMLAETAPADQIAQYGIVGLIAWMVIKECFALVNNLKNGFGNESTEVQRLRDEVERLKEELRK